MTRHNVWNAPHGPAHVAAHASVCEYAPRRAAVRAALSVLLFALVLLSRPTDALAASNPSVVYSDDGLYVVAPCDNGFDAALATIGLFSVRPRLTAEMRAKLSNASTGGDFYALAARFQQQNNTLEGFGNAVYIGILTYNTALYGAGNIMQATGVTSTDIANAKRDFNIIQNGGSLGGSGGLSGSNVVISYSSCNKATSLNWSQDYLTNLETYACTIALSSTVVGLVEESISTYPYVYVVANDNNNVNFTMKRVALVMSKVSVSPNVGTSSVGVSFGDCKYIDKTNLRISNGSTYNFDDNAFSVASSRSYSAPVLWVVNASVSGSGGGNLTNNWPDDYLTGRPIETEPPVPTPPVVGPVTYPDPTDDPLPTPPPETPITPVNPIVTTDPTNTTPQDYTPWLQAILNELRNLHRDAVGLGNNIMDAMATHCTHITTTIMDETEWLFDQLKAQIRAGVQAILNGLDQNCTEMMDYLEDLAQWLADQLQFTFNIDNSYNPEINVPAYDDGSVIAWLQRIYNAIRNIKGPTIGTPVTDKDVEDGFDWWAWLLSLLDQLFDNVISQTVGEVESFLEEFRNLFPLSIPWDVVAILTMWAGTPTTPQYEFTLFEDVAYLPEVTYEIDLSSFDATAATIRDAEKILFAFYLLFKTQWLMDTLKSATDAAGEFIEGVIS